MEHYAGIDASVESTSVCVVDAAGKIVREAIANERADLLIAGFARWAPPARIGLKAGHCRSGFMRRCPTLAAPL
jgi:hypothetical protein